MRQNAGAPVPDPAYQNLYRIGGAAAWVVAFLTVAEIVAFVFFPQPGTVTDWFILFQAHPVVGLLDFWGLEVPMYAMFALVFLALFVLLRRVNPSSAAIALALALLGVTVFFATNNPFTMLSLSNQHAGAATDAGRSALLAAGEAVLANTNQRAVGGFNLALFLVSIAGLVFSSLMLRIPIFRRSTAYLGILAFGLSLADYARQAFTSSLVVALPVILLGAVFLVSWFVLVGRRLILLGDLKGEPDPAGL